MHFTCSNKKSVQWLIQSLLQIDVQHIVISPGSRNAPLIISFANNPNFICYNIVDERSAAFYALGMAKQLKKPVAIVCTSGSAVLNYAPAISEAFYQEIPLIVITADRPPELIDQEDGQTIHQQDIYKNYIKCAISLPSCQYIDENFEAKKQLTNCINESMVVPFGPIHINIPFNEPLYDTEEILLDVTKKVTHSQTGSYTLSDTQINTWNKADKILFICGIMPPNRNVENALTKLKKYHNISILSSATSNLNPPIGCSAESVVYSNKPNEMKDFVPDLLITIGGPVISKALKQFIRNNKPKHHWDIDTNPKEINTYQCLSDKITAETASLLYQLLAIDSNKESSYSAIWENRKLDIANKRIAFENTLPWCDFLIYSIFLKNINVPIDLHLANSTPVRYIELFDKHPLINYYSNRGTSGIDGSTSTAAGAALASGNDTILITGDLSFLYDSNALWNKHLPVNLKIIVINNQGGNIFKIIKGPNNSNQIDHFQAANPTDISSLCKAYGVNYLNAINEAELKDNLSHLLNNKHCAVLEVITDADTSANTYHNYFKYLLK